MVAMSIVIIPYVLSMIGFLFVGTWKCSADQKNKVCKLVFGIMIYFAVLLVFGCICFAAICKKRGNN